MDGANHADLQRLTPLALSRSVSGRFRPAAGKVSWLPAQARGSRSSQSQIETSDA